LFFEFLLDELGLQFRHRFKDLSGFPCFEKGKTDEFRRLLLQPPVLVYIGPP
jgi:hypothetical protein